MRREAIIRPRKNAKSAEERWQPTEWRPEYESIVALSCRGFSNIHIAEKFKLTVVHISNILNSEEAKAIKNEFINAIRENSKLDAEKMFAELHDQAIKNVHTVLTNAEILETKPLAMFDKSMSFLKGVGKLQSEGSSNTTNNNLIIGEELGARLLEGLTKSDQAKKLNAGITGESIN